PGMPRDSAEQVGSRNVHFPEHPAVLALFGRRAAPAEIRAGVITGLLHAERFEDAAARELVEACAARLFDDLAEQDVVDVAVGELESRFLRRLLSEQVLPCGVHARMVIAYRIVRHEAAGVRQKM